VAYKLIKLCLVSQERSGGQDIGSWYKVVFSETDSPLFRSHLEYKWCGLGEVGFIGG
jgi:hypothetical protein